MQTLRCAACNWVLFLLVVPATDIHAQWNALNPVTAVKQEADSVLLSMQSGVMRVQVCTDSIIRVTYSPGSSFPDRPDYVVTKTVWPAVPWKIESNDDGVTLATARLR